MYPSWVVMKKDFAKKNGTLGTTSLKMMSGRELPMDSTLQWARERHTFTWKCVFCSLPEASNMPYDSPAVQRCCRQLINGLR
ncbi:hypothetical protein M514_22880 [Trichuris suis]|uniref:Uncharacterized protein n=1 Tax=Trichuris suis TaxID=68888 RepID=A0A085N641_9BILA|nr:hypothetical protein M514_22880 [Trichuris suis]